MAPRDHRIHLGRMDSPESPQNHSLAKIYFFGTPKLVEKTPPGQNVDLGVPKSDPGLPNPARGMKKQKMRAEKPCRTPPSKNLTEPYYSTSVDRKPFWGVPLKIRVHARGNLGATSPNPGISKGNLGNLKAIWALSGWYLGASWSSWVPRVAKWRFERKC